MIFSHKISKPSVIIQLNFSSILLFFPHSNLIRCIFRRIFELIVVCNDNFAFVCFLSTYLRCTRSFPSSVSLDKIAAVIFGSSILSKVWQHCFQKLIFFFFFVFLFIALSLILLPKRCVEKVSIYALLLIYSFSHRKLCSSDACNISEKLEHILQLWSVIDGM